MGRQRFEALDGLRGLAALTVLVYHCEGYIGGPPLFRGGFLSVDLFFVLSGFVIALSYEQRLRGQLSFLSFLRARARRLLPVHFWTMGILTAITLAAHAAGDTRADISVVAILAMALMNTFFIPSPDGGPSPIAFPINQSLWSLWDEWIINIVYATTMSCMRMRIVAAVGLVAAAFAIWFGWRLGGWNFGDHYIALAPSAFRALAGFAMGVVIYRAHERRWLEKLPRVGPWWIYAGWLLICANPVTESSLAYELAAALVLAPFVVALLVRAEQPVGGFVRWLGAVSYPLYASHLAVLILIGTIARHAGLTLNSAYTVPAVALALVLAQFVRMLSEISIVPALSRFALRKETV